MFQKFLKILKKIFKKIQNALKLGHVYFHQNSVSVDQIFSMNQGKLERAVILTEIR